MAERFPLMATSLHAVGTIPLALTPTATSGILLTRHGHLRGACNIAARLLQKGW